MDPRVTLNYLGHRLAPTIVTLLFFGQQITLGLGLLLIAFGWYAGTPERVLVGLILATTPFVDSLVNRIKEYRSPRA